MIDDRLPFPQAWDLEPREATTLQILLQKAMPSFSEIMGLLYGPAHEQNRKVLTVYVSHLRKKLKRHISCFEVKSKFSHGYYIPADVKLEVCARMPPEVAGRICTDPIVPDAIPTPRGRKIAGHKPRSMVRFQERLYGIGIASNGKGHVLWREETIINAIDNDFADILADELEAIAADMSKNVVSIKMDDVNGNEVIFRCSRSTACDYARRFRRQAQASRELKMALA